MYICKRTYSLIINCCYSNDCEGDAEKETMDDAGPVQADLFAVDYPHQIGPLALDIFPEEASSSQSNFFDNFFLFTLQIYIIYTTQ